MCCSAGRVHPDTQAKWLQVWADNGGSGAGSPARPGLCHTHEHRGKEAIQHTVFVRQTFLVIYACTYIMHIRLPLFHLLSNTHSSLSSRVCLQWRIHTLSQGTSSPSPSPHRWVTYIHVGAAHEYLYTAVSVYSFHQIHEQRLKAMGQLSDKEVKQALKEVNRYRELHQDRPGFFDTAINTGELH